ncbi:cyclic nucleotide-binding domain-containing protein [Aidingimonas lacisalsi]|uniref:cyclic nucleotide-binding domain-containing protein n=1 Tax=Aidingimonas lacisalsi TaxID=2604086 RepID=UPI0011D1D791|nr:cyclic nucleotide-binding domain-containing protein [Aidingimonas lacisalsi]
MHEFLSQSLFLDSGMVSLSYAIMLVAYLVRDILILRILLIVASMAMLLYGASIDNLAMLVWNSLFVAVNGVQVAILLHERRMLELPDELDRIHRAVFWFMTAREFRQLWQRGQRETRYSGGILRQGEVPDRIYLVLDGEVRVERDGHTVACLGPMYLVGEMSYINHASANADVVIDDHVELMIWTHEDLSRLERRRPHLIQKFNVIVGQDLVRKIGA